jgi:hypothetical protein
MKVEHESAAHQAAKLAGKISKKKYTCEQWMKILKKHKKKKPQMHPMMPSIIIQVNHARNKN